MLKSLASAALLSLVLFGCSATPRRSVEALPAEPRTAVHIFDRQGNPTTWEFMRGDVSGAQVIVIGESHGHPLGLAAAACLFDDVLATQPDAALLLEFFERDEQVAIDDYLAGVTDETGFKKASGRTEGNYPSGHRHMLESAKSRGRPVLAANAPRRYVRRTSAGGYTEVINLGPRQQALFVVPDPLVEGKYRDDFFGMMSGHGDDAMPPDRVEKMYRSQQMWDATMADSIVSALRAGNQPVVLVVGRFHSDFDGGTIQLLRRAEPGVTVRTLSVVARDGEEIDPEDVGRADFVVYVGASPEE